MYYTNVSNIGNNILLRGIDNGKRVSTRIPYKPKLWLKSNMPQQPSKWKALNGDALEVMEFDTIYDAREFIKKYERIENFKIYGQSYFQYAYISEHFGSKINFDPKDIVIATIDIEVGSDNGFPEPEHAHEPITAITLHIKNRFNSYTKDGRYFVFGCKEYINARKDVVYYQYPDEKCLIQGFLDVWKEHYPDIVTGWNIEKFDFPYIINRMKRLFMDSEVKRLSPWGRVNDREILDDKFGNKKIQIYDMCGISVVDYQRLYKKHSKTPNQESYKLDHISFVELKEKKLEYTGKLHDLYLNDFQKFIDYNIKDVTLVIKLNDKLKLLELAMTLAYDNKVNFNDIFSQVRMWDSITNTHLHNNGIVVPPNRTREKSEYPGGYVKEPIPGRYQYVVSYDLDGLYPHLIMMANISPETLVDPASLGEEFHDWWKSIRVDVDSLLDKNTDLSVLKQYHLCITPNKQLFRTDEQGFLAELMERMYEDRKHYKKAMIDCQKKLENDKNNTVLLDEISMLDNFQSAKKVTLNSAYGALGNQWFRFYDVRLASAVTVTGQLAIRWVQRDINDYLNKLCKISGFDFIIASDTDSMYLNLEPLILKAFPNHKNVETIKIIRAMDKLCNDQIQKAIQDSFTRLYDRIGAFAPKMNMKREAIADSAIWTSKKHYILNVWNQEGVEYTKPKVKIVGLKAVAAGSLSITCRENIKKAYEFIINDDYSGLLELRDKYKKEFNSLSVEDISMPKTCNNVEKYTGVEELWGKKTPFHVKGALIYNNMLKELNLNNKYPSIKEGDKVKYTYLIEPNPTQANVIAFADKLPKEFDIHQFIDYNMQFEKSFVDSVTPVLDAVGWKWEGNNSLEQFMS